MINCLSTFFLLAQLDVVYILVYTALSEVILMIATIQKWGNSQGVRLPLNLLGKAGLEPNDEVIISAKDKSLVITRARLQRRVTISELFENYDGGYEPVDVDWGAPVGKEVW